MSDPEDPSRLFDAPATPEGLRTVLRAAQADLGSEAQLARLAERLGPMFGVAAGAAAGASASRATLGAAGKLGVASLALLAAGGGAYWFSSPAAAPVVVPSPSALASVVSVVAASVVTSSVPIGTPSVVPDPQLAVSAGPARDKQSVPTQLTEAELLEQARAALKSDPNRALQRASEHVRRFPRGVLVQEREVLTIQALRRLGRDAEADRRAQAFSKAFPGSPFQRRLKSSP